MSPVCEAGIRSLLMERYEGVGAVLVSQTRMVNELNDNDLEVPFKKKKDLEVQIPSLMTHQVRMRRG